MNGVISSGTLLFCEGTPESLDYQILALLKPAHCTIVPAGGKYGINNFVKGRLANEKRPYLIFRDRDFDKEPEPPNMPTLLQPQLSKPIFYTYRACIESYLLDAALIQRYWQESAQGPKWGHGEPPSEEKIAEWISHAARRIADYQAVRWALTKLKPKKFWPFVSNTWTEDGKLPNSLQLDDCIGEAENLISQFSSDIATVTKDNFHFHLQQYQARFAAAEFWQNHLYLVWFHGKDLQKAMQQPHSISLKKYFNWAAQKLNIDIHPDLKNLQERISQLT